MIISQEPDRLLIKHASLAIGSGCLFKWLAIRAKSNKRGTAWMLKTVQEKNEYCEYNYRWTPVKQSCK